MKTAAILLCLSIMVPVVLILSINSFWFRADSWEEVAEVTILNFLVIGPLWAMIVFLLTGARNPHHRGARTAAVLLTYFFAASCLSSWTGLVLKLRLGPAPSSSDAKKYQYLVQAIADYRAENGMLPYSFEDLVPNYLDESPSGNKVRWSQGRVWLRDHVLYRFDKARINEGWAGLGLPRVGPNRAELSGDALIRARLAEYDRRIAQGPTNGEHYIDKTAYLIVLGRRGDARATCKAAAVALPDGWRPQMGLAVLAGPAERAQAETAFRAWLDKHPAFIHYWYLCRFYRDLGRHHDALGALRQAAKYPLEDMPDSTSFVPSAYAFDAAKYAYQQRQYELVLDITRAWSSARGIYSEPGDDFYAFRAAAELALGRMDEARKDANFVWEKHKAGGLWAGNLESLQQAAAKGDTLFIYDPGNSVSLDRWTLFPSSEAAE